MIDFEKNRISFLFCFISAVIMPTITIAGYPKQRTNKIGCSLINNLINSQPIPLKLTIRMIAKFYQDYFFIDRIIINTWTTYAHYIYKSNIKSL